ncbi:MAG: ATP-binding protein [Bacteroidetes bacterium]|nr:ATP-binding protein [Bacteroidota bacterium]MCL5026522.1 ATP-binding protein [Chloroflexota bacterium]
MLLALIPLSGVFLYAGLAMLGILARPRDRVHLAFTSYVVGLFVSSVGSFGARVQLPWLGTMEWSQLLFIGSLWPIVAYFHFAVEFLRLHNRFTSVCLIVGYGMFIALSVGTLIGLVFETSQYLDGTWVIRLGPLAYVTYAWGTLYMGMAIFLLGRTFARASSQFTRNRIFYVLVGAVATTLGSYTNVVPALAALPIDRVGYLINAACITYAMFRYRLLGMHTIAFSSLVYSTLTIALAGEFLALAVAANFVLSTMSEGIDRSVGFVLAAMVMVVFSQPARERVERWAERLVYGRGYSERMALEAFAQEMLSVLDVQTLGRTTLQVLSRTFGVAQVGVWLRSSRLGGYSLITWNDDTTPRSPSLLKPEHPIVRYLIRDKHHLTLEQMEMDATFRSLWQTENEELAANHWALFLGLRSHERLVGVLGIGPQTSGDEFTERDLALLERLAERASIAFENAALMQDLTEIEALREVNRLKDELVTTVSHELRTPLTLVLGYAELLTSGNLPLDRVRHAATEVFRGAEQLRTLVDDLLDISRLQTGRFRLQRANVDLATLVRQVVADLGPSTSQHRLEMDLPPQAPPVYADAGRIRQVLTNLITNAIKYTPGGGIITITLKADRHALTVQVSDHGIGIPKQHVGRVFEPFYRVDTPLHRQVSGTGLGLAICKHIIEAHDGQIWVTSEEGVGSTFGFALPAPDGIAGPN